MKFSLSIEKISVFLKKYHFWLLGVILFLLICFNGYVYYQYVYLTMNTEVRPVNGEIVIDQETVDRVMDIIDERKDNLTRVKSNSYYNPFSN